MTKLHENPARRAVTQSEPLPRAERWIAALLLLSAFVLKCVNIFHFRYDSDEPQHLHTTWGWTQGLLQYRDFFDNHTPLFHCLFSPLVAALGERADILLYMRFAMVPFWFVALWAVWRIGSQVFSRRAGLWATVFISLLCWWFYCALEYRTDNLWAPLWLCALALFVTGELTLKRAFAGGFLLGLCCCTSMKTSVLLAVSAMAAVFASQICARRFSPAALARLLKPALGILAGLLIAPAAVCAFFAAQGCWKEFYYCVIQHNTMISVDANVHHFYQRLTFFIALPFLLYGAAQVARHAPTPALALRRTFLFLFAGLYYASLESFWALLTRQDYLPFYPVAALVITPWVIWLVQNSNWAAHRTAILTTVAVGEIALLLIGRPPWINSTRDEQEIVREVLQLTRPGEWVMDFKGESVFRQRAFHYVLEPLVLRRIQLGIIKDTIAQDVAAKEVHVVVNRDRWYRKPTRRFLTENYLNIGQVRVAGRVLSVEETAPEATLSFPVVIPASYVLWADGKPVAGVLDGLPYTGARDLAPGPHTFRPEGTYRHLALVWERAIAAGYKPVVDRPDWQYER
ncbi:MAG: hypothetical protein WCO68_06180 [Verrucomicrobiota bacterium]